MKHSFRDKNRLRTVSRSVCDRFPSILPGNKVCESCRKKLSAMVTTIPQEQVELLDQSSSLQDFPEADYSSQFTSPSPVKQLHVSAIAQQSRERVNKYLTGLGMTPITKRKL